MCRVVDRSAAGLGVIIHLNPGRTLHALKGIIMIASSKRQKTLQCIAVAALVLGGALAAGDVFDFGNRIELSAPGRLTVRYADLDVNTTDGVAVLYHRIWVAAAAGCAVYDTRDLAHRALRRSCIDRAVVEAVAAFDNPVLSDWYLAHMKGDAHPELVAAR